MDSSLRGVNARLVWSVLGLLMLLGLLAAQGCTTPAEFEVSSLTITPSEIVAGEPVTVEVDITNVGGVERIYTASLTVDGKVVDTKDITVGAGVTKRVSLTCYLEVAGVHTIELGGLTTTVTALDTAEFEVSSLTITPSEIVAGELVTVEVDITNVGEVEGIYTASLTVDGKVVDTRDITVSAGATERVSLTCYLEVAGVHTIELGGLTTTVTALEPPAPKVGRLAPDFTLTDLEGNSVTLSDFRGKVVFINFWATWCPPCRAEMPEIEAVYQEYKSKDVVVIGVDLLVSEILKGYDENDVRQFVQRGGYSWIFVIDTTGEVANNYGITVIPTSFFVDKNGVIQAVNIGAMTKMAMESRLAEAIK